MLIQNSKERGATTHCFPNQYRS